MLRCCRKSIPPRWPYLFPNSSTCVTSKLPDLRSESDDRHFTLPALRLIFLRYVSEKNPNFVRSTNCDVIRNYSRSSGGGGWSEEIEYLDESGSVIYSGKGVRSVEPGQDGHVMVGGIKKPMSNASAVEKLVEVVRRWKWGPDLETQLDRLQFLPNMTHVVQALRVVKENDLSLSLFRWAKRQLWYVHDEECYALLFDGLNQDRDFDGIQALFDELIATTTDGDGSASTAACKQVVQYLARAEKLEVAFCCFKKVRDSGWKVDSQTYNALITLFLNRGLPYKAFEIYESMEASGSSLDASTFELMIPCLAKSGRLDAAFKLFQEMKLRSFQPSYNVFTVLVDSMGKAGRLDTSMKVYMELPSFGLRPSTLMYISLNDSFVKAGKLETAMNIWNDMKKAGFRPNFALCTTIIESHAKSGKRDIAMSAFMDMEKAGFLPTPSTYSCLLEMNAAMGNVDAAMKLYNSMTNAGLKPG